MKQEVKQISFQAQLPFQFFYHSGNKPEDPLLLLLHGYADSGTSFYRRTQDAIPTNFHVLAPHGPFPIPQQKEGVWKEAYGWYFADLSKNHTLIHPSVAVGALMSLVQHLKIQDTPKILCGFSQGGFLLPFVARSLKNVQSLIAIGSSFRSEDYLDLNFPIHAIHGSDDEIISYEKSRHAFESLATPNKHYHLIQGMTHTLNESGRNVLKSILLEEAKQPS